MRQVNGDARVYKSAKLVRSAFDANDNVWIDRLRPGDADRTPSPEGKWPRNCYAGRLKLKLTVKGCSTLIANDAYAGHKSDSDNLSRAGELGTARRSAFCRSRSRVARLTGRPSTRLLGEQHCPCRPSRTSSPNGFAEFVAVSLRLSCHQVGDKDSRGSLGCKGFSPSAASRPARFAHIRQ